MQGPPVLFIVGPTASGKTSAAVRLSSRSTLEVVNADSRQVYRGMSIGTAKPTPSEQTSVRHHLIDVANPDEVFSLATFLARARVAIRDIASRGSTPIVVGGSGQHVWALAEGWSVPAVPPVVSIRQELEQLAGEQGREAVHHRLSILDPEAAQSIDPQNLRRMIRAIEVCEVTGIRFSEQRRRIEPGFTPVVLGIRPDRATLYEAINARLQQMVDDGWVNEVQTLLTAGYGPELPSFSSAGYREISAHIAGDLTLEQAIHNTEVATHRLARAQSTWFKAADPRIEWHAGPDALTERALQVLRT